MPAAGNSHNVAALIKDFTERHLRKRRKHPEYAERILPKELAALLANVDEVSKRARRTGIAKLGVRPDIAERCLNHAQPGIIATYDTHHYVEEKRGALTQWTVHLEALRAGT